MAAQHYDAIVIGAGQAGGPLSTALARAGRTTALIEREHVGGTCINEGCTPTKTMVASARVAYLARRAADYGVHTGPVSVDMARVRQRKRDIVESFRGGSAAPHRATEGSICSWARPLHRARERSRCALNDGETRGLDADQIFINTGARPANPAVAGLDGVPCLNSTSIMELDEVPEHLLVLGGGYIGLEFGQMFRRFGSRGDDRAARRALLGREDADVADAVAEILREDGIEVLLETEPRRAARDADGEIPLTVHGRRGAHAEGLAPAGGGRPRAQHRALNLAAAGRRDRQTRLHRGQRAAGDQRARHLRAGRRQRRPGLHPHLLRRLPHPSHQPDRGRQRHHSGSPGALHRVHRPAAGPRRPERAGGAGAGPRRTAWRRCR